MSARITIVILMLTGAGCLAITPVDGALQCASVGTACPNGYYCASDHACWHSGKSPSNLAQKDMGIDGDMSIGGDAGPKASGDMAGATPTMQSCMLPSDCPMPTMPCLLQACIGGECALVSAPAGTDLPASSQKPNDCIKLVCDANGNPTPVADTTDLPIDPSGGCSTPSCSGPTPTFTPTSAGTKCNASGVCNGNGVCGVCVPGATQCKGTTASRQQCSPAGQWADLDLCPNACTNVAGSGGVCTGACNAASPAQCSSPTGSTSLGTCVSNQWAYTTCNNGTTTVCITQNGVGKCSGTCQPTPNACNGAIVTGCDSSGNPVNPTNAPCAGWCLNGACTACQPNATRCDPSNPGYTQTCNAAGAWGASTTCNAAGNTGTWSCANSGAAPTQATCACSDPNQATLCSGFECGNVTNACGVTTSCGGCGSGYRCSVHTCTPIKTTTTNTNNDGTKCPSVLC